MTSGFREFQVETVRVQVGGKDSFDLPIDPPLRLLEPFEVTLEVKDTTRLRAVVLSAIEPQLRSLLETAEMSDMPFTPTIAAGMGADIEELGQGFVVGSDGRARATFDIAGEPWSDVSRAYELGLIRHDPRRIRVLLRPPTAGVGGAGWDAFREAIKVMWTIWASVGAAHAGYEGLRAAIERFRQVALVLLRHEPDLEERGFAPADPVRLAATKRWKVGELAELLGMSARETEDLLRAFGFSQDDRGTWRSPAELSKELAMVFISALTSHDALKRDEEALRRRIQEALDAYVERGGPSA